MAHFPSHDSLSQDGGGDPRLATHGWLHLIHRGHGMQQSSVVTTPCRLCAKSRDRAALVDGREPGQQGPPAGATLPTAHTWNQGDTVLS